MVGFDVKKDRSIMVTIDPSVFEDIVSYFRIDSDYLRKNYSIELGSADEGLITTVGYLRKLSNYLKIPVSTFFLKTSPEFPPLLTDFRKSTGVLTKNTINAMRRAQWYQDILKRLLVDVDPTLDFSFSLEDDPVEAGELVSSSIGFEALRKDSRDPNDLFKSVRDKLEENNIFVFKENFPPEEARGLSLSSSPPVIVVNQSDRTTSMVFTVLHELGHLLLHKPGVSDPVRVTGSRSSVELWCDDFAAAITIPSHYLEDIDLSDDRDIGSGISEIAAALRVSKHSVAQALKRLRKIRTIQYVEYINRPFRKVRDRDTRIPPSVLALSMKGRRFARYIVDARSSDKISDAEACEILGVKGKYLDEIVQMV